MTKQAKEFALQIHAKQKYGNDPFSVHLNMVNTFLQTVTDDPEILSAGWLHDSVEDTDVTAENIKDIFGERVSSLVWAVTGEGPHRKARLENVIGKIPTVPGSSLLKSADRWSNVLCCLKNGNSLIDVYRKEHSRIITVLGDNHLTVNLRQVFE